jgi:hypothetical protein
MCFKVLWEFFQYTQYYPYLHICSNLCTGWYGDAVELIHGFIGA